jgi:HD superfamily phosphohydrolase
MIVNDTVYSTYEINSPIIIDLINTPLFKRLKQISQFGLPNEYYHKKGFSRYDHSIGVYILLDKLGASEEEKIAGLLHDISHTAFSHIVDWVLGDINKEDYQDKKLESALNDNEIATILEDYGYDKDRIGDESNFTLLERDLPNVCADRLDYSFRESDSDLIEKCLTSLKVIDNRIVFSDTESALLLSKHFLFLQSNHWGGYEAVTRYNIFSNLLKKALLNNDINISDFSRSDYYVINKLRNIGEEEYEETLELLRKKNLSHLMRSQEFIKKKFRYIDPEISLDSGYNRLSEINDEFREELIKASKENKKGIAPGVLS